jgi:hypothetical protein
MKVNREVVAALCGRIAARRIPGVGGYSQGRVPGSTAKVGKNACPSPVNGTGEDERRSPLIETHSGRCTLKRKTA